MTKVKSCQGQIAGTMNLEKRLDSLNCTFIFKKGYEWLCGNWEFRNNFRKMGQNQIIRIVHLEKVV